MEVYILNSDYEFIGVIDEAVSILWNKKYNETGYCEIYVPCSTEMLSLLQKGNYVYRYDDDMFCQIKSVHITTSTEQGDRIIATATDICDILAGRIIRWQIVYSGTVAGFIKRLLDESVVNPKQLQRRIPNFEIDESGFSSLDKMIETTVGTQDLLQLITATCNTANYGFRVSFNRNTNKLIFRLYEGKNRASAGDDGYVEFSHEYSNVISSTHKDDESNFKNVAYVGYRASNNETQLLSIYNGETEPTGEARREVYVDGTSTSRDISYEELATMFPTVTKESVVVGEKVTSIYHIIDKGTKTAVAVSEIVGDTERITVTDYTYLILIRAVGYNALASYTRTQEFECAIDTVDTYEYKTDYNLGDVVKVKNNYGIEAEAQIVEVMESEDNDNGYQCEPKFKYFD